MNYGKLVKAAYERHVRQAAKHLRPPTKMHKREATTVPTIGQEKPPKPEPQVLAIESEGRPTYVVLHRGTAHQCVDFVRAREKERELGTGAVVFRGDGVRLTHGVGAPRDVEQRINALLARHGQPSTP